MSIWEHPSMTRFLAGHPDLFDLATRRKALALVESENSTSHGHSTDFMKRTYTYWHVGWTSFRHFGENKVFVRDLTDRDLAALEMEEID